MNKISDISIIIPAYNPDENFIRVVEGLCQEFSHVLVVNDGSSNNYSEVFAKVDSFSEVILIEHSTNKGKGAALKTAFEYLQNVEKTKHLGSITVDADGQHLLKDVLNVYEQSKESGNNFFLIGVRDFSENVPLRSKFGNMLTLFMLQLFYGLKLSDSQTGLRYVPMRLYSDMIKIGGERYEYELHCLLFLHKIKETIIQCPIETVYLKNNGSSHFRPIQDSWIIYKIFFKFGLSSIISFVIDIAVFAIMLLITNHVLVSTFTARVVSGGTNFWINKNYVFSAKQKYSKFIQIFSYLLLWFSLILVSGALVSTVQEYSTNIIISFKIFVDSLLFIISYHIQKRIIFR